MWERFVNWIISKFGRKPEKGPDASYAEAYESVDSEKVTATISNSLSTKTFGDSSLIVSGKGKRVELISKILSALFEDDAGWITAQVYGKGGEIIVPTVTGGQITYTVMNQERYYITARRGQDPSAAVILAEVTEIDNKEYRRWMKYELMENGVQIIRNYATEGDGNIEIPLSMVPAWAGITEEIAIANTDRLLFASLICPRDNRTERRIYGVPITYGAEREVAEIVDHYSIYRREYKLTRPMLGLDAMLWKSKDDESLTAFQRANIETVKKTVQDDEFPFIPVEKHNVDDKGNWQYFAPPIRIEAMEGRLQSLYRRCEKACGLSEGILTERRSLSYANRDEVRASQNDTFAVVSAMRKVWERALDDLAYAVDVYAERFGITPAGARGQYEINIEWDMSLIESSEQTYTQMSGLQRIGAISKSRLVRWVIGGTVEEAQKIVDEVPPEERQGGINFTV